MSHSLITGLIQVKHKTLTSSNFWITENVTSLVAVSTQGTVHNQQKQPLTAHENKSYYIILLKSWLPRSSLRSTPLLLSTWNATSTLWTFCRRLIAGRRSLANKLQSWVRSSITRLETKTIKNVIIRSLFCLHFWHLGSWRDLVPRKSGTN